MEYISKYPSPAMPPEVARFRGERTINMNDQKIEMICKHCGHAFSAFLSEMAEHNRRVTCPGCGKVNEYSSGDLRKRPSVEH